MEIKSRSFFNPGNQDCREWGGIFIPWVKIAMLWVKIIWLGVRRPEVLGECAGVGVAQGDRGVKATVPSTLH